MTKPGKELLFVSLGGSAEIGMNLNLYETKRSSLPGLVMMSF